LAILQRELRAACLYSFYYRFSTTESSSTPFRASINGFLAHLSQLLLHAVSCSLY